MRDYTLQLEVTDSHTLQEVEWGNGIPQEREVDNRREVCEWKGLVLLLKVKFIGNRIKKDESRD